MWEFAKTLKLRCTQKLRMRLSSWRTKMPKWRLMGAVKENTGLTEENALDREDGNE